MKKLIINGNPCYTISGQLAIDTEGDPIFAACEDGDTIESILGIGEKEAIDDVEKYGEEIDIDDISSSGILEWFMNGPSNRS